MTATPIVDTFRHEAMLYAGDDGFLAGTSAFVRDACEADEPVLVVVGARKLDALRDTVGPTGAAAVLFADMADVGKNPACIIPAWRDFVAEHAADGRRVRGVGEPIWAGRTPAELIECQRHEALLNLAFADAPAWWLVCPYDVESLDVSVIDEARRTHPFVTEGDASVASATFPGLSAWSSSFDAPLPAPPDDVATLAFGYTPLGPARRLVWRLASDAGLRPAKVDDLVLAVNELATNSQRHGGGHGLLRVWQGDGEVLVEVTDAGHIHDPLVGRQHPSPDGEGGRGIWLVNQLCDLVELRSSPTTGTVVRVHMTID
jgi:anti-sigma regulatory factor (Ser/Thr protein kinase)